MSTAVKDANCPNCEAPLGGNFCANCGQEATLHHASTREFLHEFIGHYVALEGKLWGSLSRLLFRPGLLTNEYIRGRRVRFLQPLRLYLTLSLLFFALLKITGSFDPSAGEGASPDTASVKAAVDATDKIADAQAKVAGTLQPLDADAARGKAAAEAAIDEMKKEVTLDDAASTTKWDKREEGGEHLNAADIDNWLSDWPRVRHQWHEFDKLPGEQQMKVFKDGFYRYAPYAIFCLMPVFAMFLKVLYLGSGRRFGEHVLFALHTNAFAFFMFCVMLLVPFTFVRLVLWCWLLGYLPWAMRRVYHKGRFGTFWRWSVLMFCYGLSLLLAVGFSMAMGVMNVGH
jgi:hypothetical protein